MNKETQGGFGGNPENVPVDLESIRKEKEKSKKKERPKDREDGA